VRRPFVTRVEDSVRLAQEAHPDVFREIPDILFPVPAAEVHRTEKGVARELAELKNGSLFQRRRVANRLGGFPRRDDIIEALREAAETDNDPGARALATVSLALLRDADSVGRAEQVLAFVCADPESRHQFVREAAAGLALIETLAETGGVQGARARYEELLMAAGPGKPS
jgi:hypothetical protein